MEVKFVSFIPNGFDKLCFIVGAYVVCKFGVKVSVAVGKAAVEAYKTTRKKAEKEATKPGETFSFTLKPETVNLEAMAMEVPTQQ